MTRRTLLTAFVVLLPSTTWSQSDDQSGRQAFFDFLTQAKSTASADKDKVAAFYRTTGTFWRAHWLDYSHHPETYADVMALYRADQAVYPRAFEPRDPERYRKTSRPSKSSIPRTRPRTTQRSSSAARRS